MKSKFLLTTLGALALSVASSSAINLTFSTSVGVQPSNVGTIFLTQVDALTVKVLVDLSDTTLPAPQYGFVNTGNGSKSPFAFSIAGAETGLSASFIQPSAGIFSFGLLSLDLGGGTNAPYGTYGIEIASSASNGSSNAYYGDLEFNLSRTGGLLTTDFIPNAEGYYFSADLTNGSNTGSQAWNTRGELTTTSTHVPDGGATMALMGLALAGLSVSRKLLGKG